MTHTFTVTGIPRSGKNSQRQVVAKSGRRFTIKSKAAADWLAEAVSQLAFQRKRGHRPINAPCSVAFTIYHAKPLHTWDGDNVVALAMDALKKAMIVLDDNAAIVQAHSASCHVDRDRPRVEITIRELGRVAA